MLMSMVQLLSMYSIDEDNTSTVPFTNNRKGAVLLMQPHPPDNFAVTVIQSVSNPITLIMTYITYTQEFYCRCTIVTWYPQVGQVRVCPLGS